jgi:hypothetical protein
VRTFPDPPRRPQGPSRHGTRAAALLALVAVVALATPRDGRGFSDGPPPRVSGDFGGPTCRVCHRGEELNAPGGTLELVAPASWAPGSEHVLEVRLARAGMRRAGFQLTARWADGPQVKGQAGELAAEGNRVQLVAAHDVAWAAHTRGSSRVGKDGEARWSVRWTAPAEATGPVVFHVAANAGNDDDSELGDFVYTAVARSEPLPEPLPE